MYEYVCMNIDVMNMYEYVRMNIDVRVPSLIAGSLPAIMIWHKFLRLLLLTVAAFIFGLYYGRRISIANELATNQTQQDYDLAVGNMPPCEM